MNTLVRSLFALGGLGTVLAGSLAQAAPTLKVGAAVRDITPTAEMLPLTRAPGVELTGVVDPIHVRVLALSSGGAVTLLVSSETGRSLGPQLARELGRHAGVPLGAILFAATQSGAAPQVTENWTNLDIEDRSKGPVGPAGEQEALKVTSPQRWLAYAQQQLLGAADEALAQMKSATVDIGYGPDRRAAVIRFNGSGNQPLAFIVDQTRSDAASPGATRSGGGTGISAEVPGAIAAQLERQYPGAVALWLAASGASGQASGLADVQAALAHATHVAGAVRINYDYRETGIPAKAGGAYTVALQLVRIGDIALLGFPGELPAALANQIRQHSRLKDTLIVQAAWQRPTQHPGYQADDASGADAGYQPGTLGNALDGLTAALIAQTGEWTFNGDGTATGRGGRRVIVGADGIAGSTDDDQVVNPAGTVLLRNAKVAVDAHGVAYVPLGNGFNLYAGQDHELGTGDDVVMGFGRYPQSDPGGVRADPMSWRLLDIRDGKAVLAASAQLDSIQFNLKLSDGNDYVRSNLRSWLNSRGGSDVRGDTAGFLGVAFNADERAKILATRLDAPGGPPFGAVSPEFVERGYKYTTAPMDAEDLVWTLSGEEAIRYFGPSTLRGSEPSRDGSAFTNGNIVPTSYARARGVKINIGGNGPATVGYGDSWLRTTGASDGTTFYGLFLSSLGNLNGHRAVTNVYGALPVITVKLGR